MKCTYLPALFIEHKPVLVADRAPATERLLSHATNLESVFGAEKTTGAVCLPATFLRLSLYGGMTLPSGCVSSVLLVYPWLSASSASLTSRPPQGFRWCQYLIQLIKCQFYHDVSRRLFRGCHQAIAYNIPFNKLRVLTVGRNETLHRCGCINPTYTAVIKV